MKPLFKKTRLLSLLVLAAFVLNGCFFGGALNVQVEEITGFVSITAGNLETGSHVGTCFPETPGFYDCVINGITSGFELLTTEELIFTLVILDPLVVQFPADLTDFNGTFQELNTGASGSLDIQAGLSSVAIDVDRSLSAEPGTQLVVIGMPAGAPTEGNFAFNLNFIVPPGTTSIEVKPIITGLVELTDGSTFYPPILPCVEDMADAAAVTMPLQAGASTLFLPPLTADMGCSNVTYNMIPDSQPPSDDSDDDGVPDGEDACPGTVIPEAVPTRELGVNRFALVDGDTVFDTTPPEGEGPQRFYTTGDTRGCSCQQIGAELGLGAGHARFGCSISAMDEWVSLGN